MMKWKIWTVLLVMTIVPLSLFSGCSALGYGVGYLVDSAGSEIVAYPPAKAVTQLDAGDDILVVLNDGTSKQGSFDGVITLTEDEMLVEADSSVPDGCVPNAPLWPGDTITLQFQNSDPVKAIYLNADAERIYYRAVGTRRVDSARYWDINSITFCDGGVLSADLLSQYFNRNFESIFDVRLRDGDTTLTFPSLAIDHIRFDEKSIKYRRIFAGAGLVVDIFMVSAAIGLDPIILDVNNDGEE
jgi:hypothetical protein